jgi:hypothetical protein
MSAAERSEYTTRKEGEIRGEGRGYDGVGRGGEKQRKRNKILRRRKRRKKMKRNRSTRTTR